MSLQGPREGRGTREAGETAYGGFRGAGARSDILSKANERDSPDSRDELYLESGSRSTKPATGAGRRTCRSKTTISFVPGFRKGAGQ